MGIKLTLLFLQKQDEKLYLLAFMEIRGDPDQIMPQAQVFLNVGVSFVFISLQDFIHESLRHFFLSARL